VKTGSFSGNGLRPDVKTAVRAVGTISGGEGTWRAMKLWRLHNPTAPFVLVFTDTLYEDADTYRFLLDSVADLTGRKVNWIPSADEFPDYRVADDVPIAEYRGNPEWRSFLADLREKAILAFPELVWIVEGRDPWEIYRDERFVGNSRKDPCSKIIKRRAFERWRKAHGEPGNDVIIWGIGEHEKRRFEREEIDKKTGELVRRGIKPRLAAEGWQCAAPLIEYPPHPIKDMRVEIYGLRSQRLYALGYAHGNCGGKCSKAGQHHWKLRYEVQPDRFAYDAMMERKCREYIGQGTFLTETVNKVKRPLSLEAFGERLRKSPGLELPAPKQGDSGCGCMWEEAA
jgi:hypothetical protein